MEEKPKHPGGRRPKSLTGDALSKIVMIRVTPYMLRRWKAKAQRSSMSLADWLRSVANKDARF
jgi:hypothetical protein